MANQCEKCGKTLRPGTNFCGFCGHVIGDSDGAVHLPGGVYSHQGPGDLSNQVDPCPHCGKINRPGVRFCSNCGKELAAGKSRSIPTPEGSPVQPKKKRRSRIVTLGFLFAAAVVVCGSVFLAAWGFGWLDRILLPETSTATPGSVADDLKETQVPDVRPTQTEVVESKNETATPTVTATEIPPSPTITKTLPPTMTFTPAPIPALMDDFDDTLDKWYSWTDRPGDVTSNIFPPSIKGNEYLDLVGFSYDKVGVTAIQTTTIASGLSIEFWAEVADNLLSPSLYFDWYPGFEPRNSWRIGPFFLVIDNDSVNFRYKSAGSDQECIAPSDGSAMKLYRIVFGPDWNVRISVGDDSSVEEICSVTIDKLPETVGRITFSGFGFIDSVRVFEP